MTQQHAKEESVETVMEIPQYYSDGVDLTLTMPWTVALTFYLKDTNEKRTPKPQALVRMSPEQAKALALMLHNLMKKYESESGCAVNLPKELYEQLHLSETDW
jgi:hypothetical protein